MSEYETLHDVERDPVCGMTVDATQIERVHRHAGEDFHFCSDHCQQKFAARPDEFVTLEHIKSTCSP